jgi:dCMP deaminase
VIIGVTETQCAGKDSVAAALQKMNFRHVSFSEIILAERKAQAKDDNIADLGEEQRNTRGVTYLAKKALERIEDGENFVFTGLQKIEEVDFLNKRDDFVLVNVIPTGQPDRQCKNAQSRKSREFERYKLHNPLATKARIVLAYDNDQEALEKKVKQMVKDWMFKLQDKRPAWDNYFMNIAEAVKMRCNCMSAKKGAIIVRDKQILSTGYNGTPKGITHCTDGGCPRCTTRHLGEMKSGVYAEPCICAHAEENAIVQAAYNGTSTKEATIYTTFSPCVVCCKMIINAGIRRVVAMVEYPDDVGLKMLKEVGVTYEVLGKAKK